MKYFLLVLSIAVSNVVKASDTQDRQLIDGFHIDRTEVTVAQFQKFATDAKYRTKAETDGGGYEWGAGWEQRPGWNYLTPYGKPAAQDEPAAYITFTEAQQYCKWAGGQLPTAKQWSKAAYTEMRKNAPLPFEKGKTYRYSSGDKPDGLNANHTLDNFERQAPVTTMPAGVNGLYQMGGNLWEWGTDEQGDHRITLGGSWWYGAEKSRRSGFQYKPTDFAAMYIGFRCVYL